MTRANPRTSHNNAGIAAWNFQLKAKIRSWQEAYDFLAADGSGNTERDLGPHMKVRVAPIGATEGYIAVVLYDTDIIRYYPDDTFSVDNGGFATPTTMYRLNAILPAGYMAYHYKKQIRLNVGSSAHPERAGASRLWPCTHDMRIDVDTARIQLTPEQARNAILDGKRVRVVVSPNPDDPTTIIYLDDGMVMSESIAGWSAGVVEPVCAAISDYLIDEFLPNRYRLELA